MAGVAQFDSFPVLSPAGSVHFDMQLVLSVWLLVPFVWLLVLFVVLPVLPVLFVWLLVHAADHLGTSNNFPGDWAEAERLLLSLDLLSIRNLLRHPVELPVHRKRCNHIRSILGFQGYCDPLPQQWVQMVVCQVPVLVVRIRGTPEVNMAAEGLFHWDLVGLHWASNAF